MAEAYYTRDGWIDAERIAVNPAWLNVIIGGRQIGKTYGVLKLMLDRKHKFIYMRRTDEEIRLCIDNPDLSPFNKFLDLGYSVTAKKSGRIYQLYESDTQIGLALSLHRVAHIRGFSGDEYTDVVFDECIPERGAVVRSGEGDALLNAYVTINGNRELQGKPPLRLWILANSNRLDSDILVKLNVVPIIDRMARKGREIYKTSDVFVMVSSKSPISKIREDTALMRQLDAESDFYQMANRSKFAYDPTQLIRPQSTQGYLPMFKFGNLVFYIMGARIYIRKGGDSHIYRYPDDASGAYQIIKDFPELIDLYMRGNIKFDSYDTYLKFKDFFLR